jgi:hypothetical protein
MRHLLSEYGGYLVAAPYRAGDDAAAEEGEEAEALAEDGQVAAPASTTLLIFARPMRDLLQSLVRWRDTTQASSVFTLREVIDDADAMRLLASDSDGARAGAPAHLGGSVAVASVAFADGVTTYDPAWAQLMPQQVNQALRSGALMAPDEDALVALVGCAAEPLAHVRGRPVLFGSDGEYGLKFGGAD